ncbi:hypothetical protein EWM64_g7211 [Hericium alpestre]|uniref:Uncharacterized protein n=1 Tax=Hericium alpestre TaxID=135208 RepID=A0A4Y9ZRY7_9AGAM|nr:hypothetical protein EWM64_g7211 [Hericium alpestre]
MRDTGDLHAAEDTASEDSIVPGEDNEDYLPDAVLPNMTVDAILSSGMNWSKRRGVSLYLESQGKRVTRNYGEKMKEN